MKNITKTAFIAASALVSIPAFAASNSAPQAVPVAHRVPDAADTPYPGAIDLAIDASDTTRGLYRVTETLPVEAGAKELILQYPQWIPGEHAPRGPLAELVDIKFYAGDTLLKWQRDPFEVYAFHVEIPAGTKIVTAKFVHTSPLQTSEGRISTTQEMLNLQWDKMSLYPAGHYVRQIRIRPTVTFPEGWSVFTALDGKKQTGATLSWAETDYATLMDSPIFAGKYAKRWDLGHNVAIDVVADEPKYLEIAPDHLAAYSALVEEALAAYGSHHFDHYDVLLGLTDRMGGIGLEHHRSSENAQEPASWIDWSGMDWDRNVVAHEFSHSWDGKFRRPAKLWTPDYRQPMGDNLLWVYEGQNQFWGYVLAARSGVQSKEIVLGQLATVAGGFTQLAGRSWRSVDDTTMDPIFAARKPKPYPSITRGEDYYTEGALVWLEADQIIREGTAGRRGLDDFAKLFFGIKDGDWGEVGYEFDDVVAALNAVYPHDWAGFLNTRINTPGQPAPLAGIEKAGYRLVWKDSPNPYDKGRMGAGKTLILTNSLGLSLGQDGRVLSSRWDGPAFNAGIVSGAKITAVNGEAYNQDRMRAAITAAKGTTTPIQLLIQRGDRFLTIAVDYHDGLRYPWLERANDGKANKEPAGLDLLLTPRRAGAK